MFEYTLGNLIFVLIVTMLASLAAMLVQMVISRSREYLTDREGAFLCRYPHYLANGLRKLDAGAKGFPWRQIHPRHTCLS